MKSLLLFSFTILLFSCGPRSTKAQSDQFESCKKTLLVNKKMFLDEASTKERRDSMQDYLNDLEKNNLEQLVDKYEVEPEQIDKFVYSVCLKAENLDNVNKIENALMVTDSAINAIDSKNMLDSLHLPGDKK